MQQVRSWRKPAGMSYSLRQVRYSCLCGGGELKPSAISSPFFTMMAPQSARRQRERDATSAHLSNQVKASWASFPSSTCIIRLVLQPRVPDLSSNDYARRKRLAAVGLRQRELDSAVYVLPEGSLIPRIDETNAISVIVMYVHFPIPPTLIGRRQIDFRSLCYEFLVQPIHVVHNQKDHSTRYTIAGER